MIRTLVIWLQIVEIENGLQLRDRKPVEDHIVIEASIYHLKVFHSLIKKKKEIANRPVMECSVENVYMVLNKDFNYFSICCFYKSLVVKTAAVKNSSCKKYTNIHGIGNLLINISKSNLLIVVQMNSLSIAIHVFRIGWLV